MTQNESVELPHFIIADILSYVTRRELNICGDISREWRKAVNEVRQSIVPLVAFPIGGDKVIQYTIQQEKLFAMIEDSEPEEIISVETFNENYHLKAWVNTATTKIKISPHWYSKPHIRDLDTLMPPAFSQVAKFLEHIFQECQSRPKLLRQHLFKRATPPGFYSDYTHIYLIEISIRELERMAKEEKYVKIPLPFHFHKRIATDHETATVDYFSRLKFDDIHIPKKAVVTQSQPFGFDKSISLYKYQLDVVAWMKSIETDSKIGFDYIDLRSFPSSNSKLRFDNILDYAVSPAHFDDFSKTVYPIGGILADEMGLGKTMEIIALILANPGNPSILDVNNNNNNNNNNYNHTTHALQRKPKTEANDEINKLKEEEEKKNTAMEPKEQQRRYSWRNYVPPPRPQNRRQMENDTEGKIDNSKYIRTSPKGDLFVTNATLVLCPAILMKQWTKEIETATKPNLNLIILDSMKAVNNCSIRDIMDADIVLLSHSILLCNEYLNIGNYSAFPSTNISGKERHEWVAAHFAVVRSLRYFIEEGEEEERRERIINKIHNSINMKRTLVDHFWWHRIVIDEAHELINDKVFKEMICYFHANYRWYVTATPFPNSKSLSNICDYLEFPVPKQSAQKVSFANICKTHLYWRNTKESVKSEYELPPLIEDIVMIDFAPIERIIYNDAIHYLDQEDICKVCFGPFLSLHYQRMVENVSLNSFNKTMLANIKTKLAGHPETIAKYKKKVAKAKAKIEQLKPDLEKAKEDHYKTTQIWEKIPLHKREEEESHKKFLAKHNAELQVNKISCLIAGYNQTLNSSKKEIKIAEDRMVNDSNSVLDLEEMGVFYSGPDMSSSAVITIMEREEPVVQAQNENKEKDKEQIKEDIKNVEQKKEEDNVEEIHQEVILPWSKIIELTIPKLKEELAKRGVEPNKKQTLKKSLQNLLRDTVKNNIKPIATADVVAPTLKRKNSGGSKANNKRQKKDQSDKRTTQDKINENNLLMWWMEKHGSKIGNLLFYFKRLWSENPDAKVIVFSQFDKLLTTVAKLLSEQNITNSIFSGKLNERGKKLAEFTSAESETRVLFLNINENSSGLNIVEATHIIIMEPVQGGDGKAIETQAIGRAHRQGQKSRVTVVRFIVRDTVEHEAYKSNYGITKAGSMLGDF